MRFVLISIVILVLFQCSRAKQVYKSSNQSTGHFTQIINCGVGSRLLLTALKAMDHKLEKCIKTMKGDTLLCTTVPKNCADVFDCGGRKNGVYTINPDGKDNFKVYCDQTTTGGGWTVIQRRRDGTVDFYRGWKDYKNGFGNLQGEVWLGLDKINRLTQQTHNRLRVELEETTGKSAYAEYDYFAVASENSKYKLSLGVYSGTAGDSLSSHRNAPFTTKDRDNDKSGSNCAVVYSGAWWYTSCHDSNLNGLYQHGSHKTHANGINWQTWKGYKYSAKKSEMKIRPVIRPL